MDVDYLHTIMKRISIVFTIIWSIFLLPSFLLMGLLSQGMVDFQEELAVTEAILTWMMMLFPFMLLIAIAGMWSALYYKKYWTALGFALLPLVNLLVEIVAADIALIFA